jgi:hypothetical protein
MAALYTGTMDTNNCDDLQRLIDYRAARKTVRSASWFTLGVGTVIVLGTIGVILDHPAEVPILVFLAVAIGIVIGGLANLIRPFPFWLLVDGVLILTLAVALGYSMAVVEGPDSKLTALLFALLLAYALHRFVKYRRCRLIWIEKPTEESLTSLNRLIQTIKDSRLEEGQDFIEFWIGPVPIWQERLFGSFWKGQLGARTAVFVDHAGCEAIIAPKEAVTIAATRELPRDPLAGPLWECTFHFKDQTMEGAISPICLSRYHQWKDDSRIGVFNRDDLSNGSASIRSCSPTIASFEADNPPSPQARPDSRPTDETRGLHTE